MERISRNTDPVRDPVLADDFVLSLVRRHVSDAHAVTGVDESGGEARCYLIDDNVVLNTQRPHRVRPRTSLERHGFFLDHIARGAPDLPVARKLGYGREGEVEYLCMTRIPGVPSRYASVSGPARAEMLRELGRTLRRIHSLPQQPFLESGLFPADVTNAEFTARVRSSLEEAVRGIEEQGGWRLGRSPEAVAQQVIEALPRLGLRVALHSNPGPEHVFIDPETGTFQGLIDFGDAYVSHPALDLRRWIAAEDRAALIEGYSSINGGPDDEFMQTWRALLALGAMTTISGRLGPGTAFAPNPDARHRAEQTLRELLAEG